MAATPTTISAQLNTLVKSGRVADAVALLERAHKTHPRDEAVLVALAQLHKRVTHDFPRAQAAGERAVKVMPKSARAHLEVAEAACKLKRFDTALKHLKRARALAPRNADVLYVASSIYHQMDRHDDAIAAVQASLAVRPDHLQARLQLATVYRAAGQMDDARALCRDIFAQTPDNLVLHSIYGLTGKMAQDDPMYLYLRDKILPDIAKLSQRDQAKALALLAKARDDMGAHDDAFTLYTRSKKTENLRHDGAKYHRFVAAQCDAISPADYFGGGGSQDETPVLIVGMPRSGSTLLEQVLTSHPKIAGVGESAALSNLMRDLKLPEHDGAALARLTKGLTQKDSETLAQKYLTEVRKAAPKAARIVDKKLHNFELLGVFARMFPKGRILHARRDPMDNCVSCYMQPLSVWHSYTRDLADLGRYYCDYDRLMQHWATVLPIPMMDVHYEDMVADTEGTARGIIDFLGLDWDPACLDFQSSEKRARTLSVWQVRQPVYKTSVQRWRSYDAHLDPLKSELGRFYPDGLG